MLCWLSLLLFSILISLSDLQLRKGFRRVPLCPTPNNITAWKEASAVLGCTDDLENEDPKELNDIYNCMPSNYLNETVAFCGPMTAITEGNCPVLNYERNATVPTGRPCSKSNFTNGCPKKLFHTRETYKHPACLKINTLEKCYFADPGCPKNVTRRVTTLTDITTIGLGRTTASNLKNKSSEHIVIALLGSAMFFIIIIVVIIFLRRRKICPRQSKKTDNPGEMEEKIEMIVKKKNSVNDEDTTLMSDNTPYEVNEIETIEKNSKTSSDEESKRKCGLNQCLKEVTACVDNEKEEDIEEIDQLLAGEKESENDAKEFFNTYGSEDIRSKEDGISLSGIKEIKGKIAEEKETGNVVKENITVHRSEVTKRRMVGNSMPVSETPKTNTAIWDEDKKNRLFFNDFYLDLIDKMIEKDLVQKMSVLLQDKREENTVNQREKFIQWNKEHNFQCNIWHLQQLLKKCGAVDLVEECAVFAKCFPLCLAYFECTREGQNHELITLHTSLDISNDTVRREMEEIREILATLLHLEPREIKLCGVKEGSLILVFSLPKENVTEMTKINLSNIWSLRVFRIETKNWIIEPGLLKSKCMLILYVQVQPRHSRIQDRLQLLVLAINGEMKGLGFHIKTDCHNIKCKIWKNSCAEDPLFKGRKSIENNSLPFEKEILENMEPSIVKEFLKTCLPGYHREIEDLFSPTHARKQTAKAILLFLSGKKRKVFKNTMNCVIDMYRSKEIPTCDSAMAEENGLFENTEMLLDDIDSSIINDTFEKIGDVPFDIVQKCSPGSGRKRKERAKTFYDFVNLNKEHLQIFKNILQSNAD